MNGICRCCEQQRDLRLGYCFDCAECESIIEDGTDMYDKEPPHIEGQSKSMDKLKYILHKFNLSKKNT